MHRNIIKALLSVVAIGLAAPAVAHERYAPAHDRGHERLEYRHDRQHDRRAGAAAYHNLAAP